MTGVTVFFVILKNVEIRKSCLLYTSESLALGSASFTPLQVARGYSVMANGGFLVNPFFISKIENDQGCLLYTSRCV